jgi:hypothetical protein
LTGEGPVGVVGREAEVGTLSDFVTSASPVRALVLTGGPGIGKTTLWEAGIDLARERGWRALSARPSSAEARASFGGLIDLCEGVDDGVLADLPAPQREALRVALLRAAPTGTVAEPHAIALRHSPVEGSKCTMLPNPVQHALPLSP